MTPVSPLGLPSGEHFAPSENLERLEMQTIASARRWIDLCMFAFTDLRLARDLVNGARGGGVVRIYHDGEQFEQEQRRSARYGRLSTTVLFSGQSNIHSRVKSPWRWYLQHLKEYCVDRTRSRDGSANFFAVRRMVGGRLC